MQIEAGSSFKSFKVLRSWIGWKLAKIWTWHWPDIEIQDSTKGSIRKICKIWIDHIVPRF